LLIGGIVLLALGLVGFLGVFNDTMSAFYLDQGENVAQTGLGIIAIAAAFLIPDATPQKWLVAVVGVTALFFAVYGAGNTPPNTFGISNLESPADDIPSPRRWHLGTRGGVSATRADARRGQQVARSMSGRPLGESGRSVMERSSAPRYATPSRQSRACPRRNRRA
jgi:hypothetical protein